MTEYESATLAIRTAGLWAACGQIAAALAIGIGIGQIAIVAFGIRAMNRASAEQARDRSVRAAEQDQRHTEAMRALEALIVRTGPRSGEAA